MSDGAPAEVRRFIALLRKADLLVVSTLRGYGGAIDHEFTDDELEQLYVESTDE